MYDTDLATQSSNAEMVRPSDKEPRNKQTKKTKMSAPDGTLYSHSPEITLTCGLVADVWRRKCGGGCVDTRMCSGGCVLCGHLQHTHQRPHFFIIFTSEKERETRPQKWLYGCLLRDNFPGFLFVFFSFRLVVARDVSCFTVYLNVVNRTVNWM